MPPFQTKSVDRKRFLGYNYKGLGVTYSACLSFGIAFCYAIFRTKLNLRAHRGQWLTASLTCKLHQKSEG